MLLVIAEKTIQNSIFFLKTTLRNDRHSVGSPSVGTGNEVLLFQNNFEPPLQEIVENTLLNNSNGLF